MRMLWRTWGVLRQKSAQASNKSADTLDPTNISLGHLRGDASGGERGGGDVLSHCGDGVDGGLWWKGVEMRWSSCGLIYCAARLPGPLQPKTRADAAAGSSSAGPSCPTRARTGGLAREARARHAQSLVVKPLQPGSRSDTFSTNSVQLEPTDFRFQLLSHSRQPAPAYGWPRSSRSTRSPPSTPPPLPLPAPHPAQPRPNGCLPPAALPSTTPSS